MKKSYKTLALSLATILVFTGCASAEPVTTEFTTSEQSNLVSIGSVKDKVTVPSKEPERVIYENNQALKIEVSSYDLIDDTDISKQTKYDAKYFVEGKVPDSDFSIVILITLSILILLIKQSISLIIDLKREVTA